VVVWGVTLPPTDYGGKEGAACGNSWIPLLALKVGPRPISAVTHCTALGLLMAGDTEGNVVIWDTNMFSSSGSSKPERFRAHLDDEVVNSIVMTELAIFVGTKSGLVYACNGPDDRAIVPLPAIAKLAGDLGSVTHMMIAPFWRIGCGMANMVALYVSFSNGYVAIVNAYTRELLGFAKSCIQTTTMTGIREGDLNALPCLQYDDQSRGYYPVRYSAVLTSTYQLAAEQLKEIEVDMDESSDTPENTPTGAIDTRASDDKRGSWLGAKMSRASLARSPSSAIGSKSPPDAPKYLIQVCNTSVVIFDLSKLTVPVPSGSVITKVKDASVPAQETVCRRIHEFCDPIVAAQGVTYIEDAARFWATPILAISCVDSLSTVTQLAFSGHELNAMCEVELLENVSIEVSLMGSVVLENGNVYMLHSDTCIFSATPTDKKFVPILPVPVRLRTDCVPPHPSQLLLTGIEDGTLSLSKAGGAVGAAAAGDPKNKKRRSSIMGMVSSAPVELDKLFMKTRAQLQKSELFTKEGDEDEDDDDDVVQKNSAKSVIATSQAINANVMDETRQAFEERGEKLSRIAKRSAAMSDGAVQYKQNVHAHKEKLRKKAARWGLF
jgi:hypothetical protein